MIKTVHINFNQDNGPGQRASEHISFPYQVTTLADVPLVGDYIALWAWSEERQYYRRNVAVTGRLIYTEPRPEDRFDEHTEMTYIVTLMVKPVTKSDGMPDFRG